MITLRLKCLAAYGDTFALALIGVNAMAGLITPGPEKGPCAVADQGCVLSPIVNIPGFGEAASGIVLPS